MFMIMSHAAATVLLAQGLTARFMQHIQLVPSSDCLIMQQPVYLCQLHTFCSVGTTTAVSL
jgi:hypothetical protein